MKTQFGYRIEDFWSGTFKNFVGPFGRTLRATVWADILNRDGCVWVGLLWAGGLGGAWVGAGAGAQASAARGTPGARLGQGAGAKEAGDRVGATAKGGDRCWG